LHYARWLMTNHPEAIGMFYSAIDKGFNVSAEGGGDTDAPQTKRNPIPRDWYHTDWVADRTIAWLDSVAIDDDWFCWMSFPDPHHPWDPPESEMHRVDWHDVPLPAGYPVDRAQREKILDDKEGVCGYVVDKVNILKIVEGLINKGFNVRLPTEKIKPMAVPVGIEPSMKVQGRQVDLAIKLGELAITNDMIWLGANVHVDVPDAGP